MYHRSREKMYHRSREEKLMQKTADIAAILSNSVYLPTSGVYEGAKAALETLSAIAVGQIRAVVYCKSTPKDT